MWSLISRKTQLTIIVGLTAIILFGLQGFIEMATGSKPSGARLLSVIVFVVGTVLVALFNISWRWFWKKAPIMNKLFFPDLNGTWNGELKTTWVNPETGQSPGPIPATITITQNLLDISVRQRTGESTSYSNRLIAEAEPNADRYRLWYSYSNRPKAEFAYRSANHEGIAWLEINLSDDPNRLEGQYYTGRRTSGDMLFRRNP